MIIYPAIDIRGGRAVRLLQGRADQETVYAEQPETVAAEFKAAGSAWVHVVDLDGAFSGEPQNLAAVQAIAAMGMKVELGGGLRTKESVERALGFGVSRVVIGTRAAESERFVGELVEAFGEKIAVGIDAKDGKVAVKGWVDTTCTGALDLARRMDAIGVRTIIYTDISTDGMLTGPNFAAQETMLQAGKFNVIASGGVGNLQHLVDGITKGRADAVLAASIFHYGSYTVRQAKEFMAAQGIAVRL
jgi:phosphoribosylformimino-5-aminoimidazole carboxamide ribotide isomerase